MQRYNSPGRRGGSFNNGGSYSPRNSPQNQCNSSFQFTPPAYQQQHLNQSTQHANWQQQQQHRSYQFRPRYGSPYKKNYNERNTSIEAYFKPSMLEDPWKKLEEKMLKKKMGEEEK